MAVFPRLFLNSISQVGYEFLGMHGMKPGIARVCKLCYYLRASLSKTLEKYRESKQRCTIGFRYPLTTALFLVIIGGGWNYFNCARYSFAVKTGNFDFLKSLLFLVTMTSMEFSIAV